MASVIRPPQIPNDGLPQLERVNSPLVLVEDLATGLDEEGERQRAAPLLIERLGECVPILRGIDQVLVRRLELLERQFPGRFLYCRASESECRGRFR